MTQKQKYALGPVGVVLLGTLTYLIGSHRAEMRAKEDLASELVGNSISIVDRALGEARLTDIDHDGDWDYLGIHNFRRAPGAVSNYVDESPDRFYVKSNADTLSRSIETEHYIIDEESFNRVIQSQNVPMPGDSLLNKDREFESYSGLFNPDFD